MDFKTIFGILKKYLADGYEVPEFFRDLMALTTEVSPEILRAHIDERPLATRKAMADDLRGYEPFVDENNVGEIASNILAEIIQEAVGFIPQDALTKQKQQQLAVKLHW